MLALSPKRLLMMGSRKQLGNGPAKLFIRLACASVWKHMLGWQMLWLMLAKWVMCSICKTQYLDMLSVPLHEMRRSCWMSSKLCD